MSYQGNLGVGGCLEPVKPRVRGIRQNQIQRFEGLRPKCEYLGDSGVLFFCFFRNFKAVLMSFVFKASIQIFSFRFSDFLLLASARAGPEGPAQGWP